jgi:hypothetical protein
MSNYLAIATATTALGQLLQTAANEAVPGATVTTVRPESMDSVVPDPAINVYLYQVVPNPAWRNADLPTRRGDGTMIQVPQAALDLHYLLTFYGDEGELEPQRLLGSATSVLHARPVLTREMIRAAVSAVTAGDSDHYLNDSDLAEQIETVKFVPLPLNLEELSKLWTVFFQTPYALSVTYRGSVVLIEAQGTPQRALPVRKPLLYSTTFRQPLIEQVLSQAGADQPIVAGTTLLIQGQRLRGDMASGADATHLRIGEVELTPDPEDVSNKEIRLALTSPPFPAGALRAGVRGVQVVHPMMMGDPPVLHRGVESNVAPFVLRPTVAGIVAPDATELTVTFNPAVGRTQRVVLLLNEFNPPSDRPVRAYSFEAPADNGIEDDAEATAAITFAMNGVASGEYLVRVQVDGAESPLTVDADPDSPTFNKYVSPTVTIP